MNARKTLLLSAAILAGLLPVACDTNEARLPSQPTNLGNFQSAGGLQEVELEFFSGEINVPLFAGATAGTARVRAEVNGGVGIVHVLIVCPSEGCGGGGFTEDPPEGEISYF